MIQLNDILDNPRLVRADDGMEFIASAIRDKFGVIGLAHWRQDQRPIRRGKHMLISAESRNNWFLHLDLVDIDSVATLTG